MATLICGSIAFDTIMVFEDQFKNHILPDKIHILNVSFLTPRMRREFGGCAGNIAHTLQALGGDGIPMATVGSDFGPYRQWLKNNNVNVEHITEIDGNYTAQAFITTDLDDNQITAFHPGAMQESHQNKVDAAQNIHLGIVSPDGKQGMIEHAQQFVEADIPFVFDPGQSMPLYDGPELSLFIEQASYLTFNDYEAQLLMERTGFSLKQLVDQVNAVVITRGGEGATIYVSGKEYQIPVATPTDIHDPTGCGDAFRAGLLHGITQNMDWETTGRVASLCGAYNVEQHGTQNHQFNPESFAERFKENFNFDLN